MITEYGTKDEIRKEALVCVEEGKGDRVLVEHGVVGEIACVGRKTCLIQIWCGAASCAR